VGVLREVLPAGFAGRPELDALLALMLLQHSRRDARERDGAVLLLAEQDRTRWHADEIDEAVALLSPLTDAPAAPYLLQALIAAEHAIAASPAATNWSRIADRYRELEELTGSPVVRLNRAVAVAEADGPLAGLRLLEGLDPVAVPGHRLPATRAALLVRAGRLDAARTAYDEAIGRCRNLAERAHLLERRARL
jgi:RNA polymerase sigma-70 factor (ECF subfamily)